MSALSPCRYITPKLPVLDFLKHSVTITVHKRLGDEQMEALPKIKKSNISDQVFDILKNNIAEGKFKVGEKLPSENELCAMLGVSRPSVNAAVNRLRAMGLVEVRPGDGSYVKSFSSSEYIKNYADLVKDVVDIQELLEIRRALDIESFRLAMERATVDDFNELKNITERYKKARIKKNYDAAADIDFEFHLKICRCSKNRYFTMMYELIGDLLRRQIKMFQESQERHGIDDTKIIDDHVRMYEALVKKDFDTYLSVLEDHTDYKAHMD